MTLLDCISQIDENAKRVNVYWHDELVTYYDGKNSINERYNSCPIESVFYDNDKNTYYIDLATEYFICPECGCLANWDELLEVTRHGKNSYTHCPNCGTMNDSDKWRIYTI